LYLPIGFVRRRCGKKRRIINPIDTQGDVAMKTGLWFKAAAVVIMVGLAALPASADPLAAFKGQKGEVRISGGTAHIPVMEEAARRIRTANPDVQISIAGGGSGVGIKQAGEGLVDIGNSGRKPTDEEVSKYGLKVFRWALDGVGIVVHPDNPVQSLGKDQLKQIYAGTIDNWQALGGPDKAINLYTRDEASGTRDVFWSKALDKGEIHARANVVPSNGAMKTAVANDPYAIGYVSVGHIDATVAPVALDGVVPTIETVKSGAYPVSRGLFSLTKGEPQGLARWFIDYLFSPAGHEIIADKGFIPVD
jgi:phosphate transport system substrate-binding protein